jgi:hypothetical protein
MLAPADTPRVKVVSRPLFRIDPGWLFVIAGLAMLSAVIVLPGRRAVHDMREQLRVLKDQEALAFERLNAYEQFVQSLRQGDEQVIRRLAASHLNLVPEGQTAVMLAESLDQTVPEWIDETVDVSPSHETPYDETLLVRLSEGKHRLWLLCGSVLVIFFGLLMGPDFESRARAGAARSPRSKDSDDGDRDTRGDTDSADPNLTEGTATGLAAEQWDDGPAATATLEPDEGAAGEPEAGLFGAWETDEITEEADGDEVNDAVDELADEVVAEATDELEDDEVEEAVDELEADDVEKAVDELADEEVAEATDQLDDDEEVADDLESDEVEEAVDELEGDDVEEATDELEDDDEEVADDLESDEVGEGTDALQKNEAEDSFDQLEHALGDLTPAVAADIHTEVSTDDSRRSDCGGSSDELAASVFAAQGVVRDHAPVSSADARLPEFSGDATSDSPSAVEVKATQRHGELSLGSDAAEPRTPEPPLGTSSPDAQPELPEQSAQSDQPAPRSQLSSREVSPAKKSRRTKRRRHRSLEVIEDSAPEFTETLAPHSEMVAQSSEKSDDEDAVEFVGPEADAHVESDLSELQEPSLRFEDDPGEEAADPPDDDLAAEASDGRVEELDAEVAEADVEDVDDIEDRDVQRDVDSDDEVVSLVDEMGESPDFDDLMLALDADEPPSAERDSDESRRGRRSPPTPD